MPDSTNSPLYQLRRLLAPNLAPTQALVPLPFIAAACGLSPQTWRRAESKPSGLSSASRASIRVSMAALGYRITNAHLLGEQPLPDPPTPTKHPQSTLAALHAMLLTPTALDEPSPIPNNSTKPPRNP